MAWSVTTTPYYDGDVAYCETVCPRDRSHLQVTSYTRSQKLYPAPTLHEIMAELSLCNEYCDTGWFCMVGDPDNWSIGNCECDLYVKNGTENKSPEAAALKLWLKLKGIEYEQKQS